MCFSFKLLGGCSLIGVQGPVTGRAVQRRRLACLSAIAVAGPRSVSRDKLIALLWPESSGDRSRRLLSDTLYVLRLSLGQEALLTPGDAVSLNTAQVECDVAAFDEALERGDPAGAVAVYGGPLLDGFHLPDAPEFERWMDAERERLTQAYAKALETLATEAERREEAEAAVAWWRRLAAVQPYNARVVRRLAEAMAAGGDRVGARRQVEIHATLLREELEAEPELELLEYAARLCSAPPAVPEAEQSAPVPLSSPPSEDPIREAEAAVEKREKEPSRRARKRVGVAVVALLIAGAAALYPKSRSVEEGAPAELVAVLPFTVHGDPEVLYLGDAIVDRLGTSLDGAGDIRAVNPRSVLNVLRGGTHTPDRLDTDLGERTAARFRAGSYILGTITEANGRLWIRAELYRRGGRSPVAAAAAEGEVKDFFTLADRLAAGLLAGSFDSPYHRLSRAAALSAPTLPALRAYLQGERDFRAVEDVLVYERATESFRRAVELDSTFALAQYRLAVAAHWLGRSDIARQATERAFRFRDRLGARDQQLLAAWRARQLGDVEAAERTYQDLLLWYPEDPEVYFQYGDLLYQANPFRARSRTEALAPVRQALRLDPRNGCARCLLMWLELTVGDPAAADSLVTGFDPPQLLLQRVIAAAAVVRGSDAAAREALLGRLASVDDMELAVTTWFSASSTRDPAFLRRLFSLMTVDSRTAELRALGEVMLFQLALLQGQLGEADRSLHRLADADPALALAHRALLAAYPYHTAPPAELAATAGALSGGAEMRIVPPVFLLPDSAYLSPIRSYLTDLVALRMGERVRTPSGDSTASALRPLVSLLETDLQARAWLAQGRPEQALESLRGFRGTFPSASLHAAPMLAFTNIRYLRGEVLLHAGRAAEALDWYRSVGEIAISDWPYVAPAALRQAQVHERLGDRDEAVRHYRRFIRLWAGADADLQPMVHEAREALARL